MSLRMAASGASTFPRRRRRQVMISEYGEWLRTQTNRHGRPFQAGDDLGLPGRGGRAELVDDVSPGLEADFTGCDTAALNRFFRAYLGVAQPGRGRTPSSGIFGTCSAGWRSSTGIRTRTPMARCGTRR